MFAKLSIVFVAVAAATSVVASPWNKPKPAGPAPVDINQCNVSNQKCCNQMQDYDQTTMTLIKMAGINATGMSGQMGMTCSPLMDTMGEQTTCTANPVCCTGDSSNGMMAFDCSPMSGMPMPMF